MSFLVNHFNMFWYIDIPTVLAVLFYLGVLIFRAFLMRGAKKDEELVLEAVANCLGYDKGQAKGLRIVRYLLDDNRDDGFAVLLESGDLIKIPRIVDGAHPMRDASKAINIYLRKYEKADATNRVAIFILGSCLLAFTVSLTIYCMILA